MTREQLAKQDGRTAAVAMVGGFLLLVLGSFVWVSTAKKGLADAVALGQILVLLSLVMFLGSIAYGIAARFWRYSGQRE